MVTMNNEPNTKSDLTTILRRFARIDLLPQLMVRLTSSHARVSTHPSQTKSRATGKPLRLCTHPDHPRGSLSAHASRKGAARCRKLRTRSAAPAQLQQSS